MRILGLDVCAGRLVGCLLTEGKPKDIRAFYRQNSFYHFGSDADSIERMIALHPDIAVLEPTGGNYSRLFVEKLTEAGVKVVLVPNNALNSYRANIAGTEDKDDELDSLCLALYYLDFSHDSSRFLSDRDSVCVHLRSLVHRIGFLNRLISPLVQLMRQRLWWQFPEVAKVRSRAEGVDSTPLLWGWIAGLKTSKKYDDLYAKSIGQGISQDVRDDARRYCDLCDEEHRLRFEINNLLQLPQFNGYRQVFTSYGFGTMSTATILSTVYPVEQFFQGSDKPIIERTITKGTGKEIKRRISERRFAKALGVCKQRQVSGKSKKTRKTGSALCRTSVYLWLIFTPGLPQRRTTPELQTIGAYFDRQVAKHGTNRGLIRSNTMVYTASRLFRALVEVNK